MNSGTATQIERLVSERNRFRNILLQYDITGETSDLEQCIDDLILFFFDAVNSATGYRYSCPIITDDGDNIIVTDNSTAYDLGYSCAVIHTILG